MRTQREILKAGIDQEIEREVKSLSKAFSDCIDPSDINRSQLCVSFERRLRKLVNFAREAGE